MRENADDLTDDELEQLAAWLCQYIRNAVALTRLAPFTPRRGSGTAASG
jgi:hypothetical protein